MSTFPFPNGNPHNPQPLAPLTPGARSALETVTFAKSGDFAHQLIEALRRAHDPESLILLFSEVARVGRYYPHLHPIYCNTPLDEIVREARRTLKTLWKIEDLTVADVALMFDHDLLATIERHFTERARL